jgi:hypothetical protein
MDIRERVLQIRSKRDKSELVNHFVQTPSDIPKLLQLIKDLEPYPNKEYASWSLIHLIKSKQLDLQHLYNDLVGILYTTDDQSVLRNVTCCLSHLKITEYRESEFIDLLILFIQTFENKVALQVYSMRILILFCKKYPELTPEIMEVIDLNQEGKTAAYGSARRDFIKKLKIK